MAASSDNVRAQLVEALRLDLVGPDNNHPFARELHAATDRAVPDACGLSNIPTDCELLLDYEEDESDDEASRKRKKPWRCRWPDEVRDEVLARLLALNAQRAEEECLAGAAQPLTATPKRKRGKVAAPGGLFD